MKMYLTRYSLASKGEILLRDVTVSSSSSEYVYDDKHIQYRVGRDAFEVETDAIHAVFKAREKKIASLQKQIRSLENISISVDGD